MPEAASHETVDVSDRCLEHCGRRRRLRPTPALAGFCPSRIRSSDRCIPIPGIGSSQSRAAAAGRDRPLGRIWRESVQADIQSSSWRQQLGQTRRQSHPVAEAAVRRAAVVEITGNRSPAQFEPAQKA